MAFTITLLCLSYVISWQKKIQNERTRWVEQSTRTWHQPLLFWCVCLLRPVSSAHSGQPNIWGMFWRRLGRRHGSAQTAVAVRVARLQSKNRWQILGHDPHQIDTKSPRRSKFVFLTPCWWREIQCVPTERRFGIFQFGIFYFPSCVFSPPIHWGAGGGCFIPPISPNALRTPLQCISMHCIAVHCTAARTVICSAITLSLYCSESHAVKCKITLVHHVLH